MTAKIRTKTTTVQRYTRANVIYKPQPNKLQVVIQTRDVKNMQEMTGFSVQNGLNFYLNRHAT